MRELRAAETLKADQRKVLKSLESDTTTIGAGRLERESCVHSVFHM